MNKGLVGIASVLVLLAAVGVVNAQGISINVKMVGTGTFLDRVTVGDQIDVGSVVMGKSMSLSYGIKIRDGAEKVITIRGIGDDYADELVFESWEIIDELVSARTTIVGNHANLYYVVGTNGIDYGYKKVDTFIKKVTSSDVAPVVMQEELYGGYANHTFAVNANTTNLYMTAISTVTFGSDGTELYYDLYYRSFNFDGQWINAYTIGEFHEDTMAEGIFEDVTIDFNLEEVVPTFVLQE